MAEIAPLRPLRYTTADLASVVAPPYDVIDEAERAVLLQRSPHNVVRLILPEGAADQRYANAGRLLERWRASGVLARDETPALYPYHQTYAAGEGGARRTRSGFLALVRAAPYAPGAVLPHERTLAGPKEDRLKLFRATRANLSPGFMLYRDPAHALDGALRQALPVAAFTTGDGIEHRLGRVTDQDAIARVLAHVRDQSLLIADGHHRYETARRYAAEIDGTDAGRAACPSPEHRYFMAFLCNADDEGLTVRPTHRLVHSLPEFSWDRFQAAVTSEFTVTDLAGDVRAWTAALEREHRTTFVAIVPPAHGGAARAVLLQLRSEVELDRHPALRDRPPAVRRLAVAVLHALILEARLGVTLEQQEQKTRVTYVQDPAMGVDALARGEGQVLFLLNPTLVAEVRNVAEAGEVMPQKSTYFYPKVLTGLAIHTLDPQRSVAFAGATPEG